VSSTWASILAAAAGVTVAKVLPPLVLPSREMPQLTAWLRYLPAAVLGAVTFLAAADLPGSPSQRWAVMVVLAATAVVAIVTRKTATSLVIGGAAVITTYIVWI
jgi:branched-subunit amino acid transport protein